MAHLSELWRELVARASEDEKAEALIFGPYIDDLSRRLRQTCCGPTGEPVGAPPPPLATQPYTVYMSAADYEKQAANGDTQEGGTSLLDPATGLVVGVVDANGALQTGSATANLETVEGDNTGKKDCAAAFEAKVGPEGTVLANDGIRMRFPKEGRYRFDRFVDLHPSISLRMDARGGILVVPNKDLPETAPDGAPAALLRLVRRTPDSSKNLAWAPTLAGFNIDFRGVHQDFPIHGVRIPCPIPAINPIDPDPRYLSNKDYVAGRLECADIIGATGTGYLVEAGNGRFDVDSARALNCGLNGFELLGNDVVMYGHWGAGGCGQWAVKAGQAAGFLATTGNLWGNPPIRSLTCGAMFINQRQSFAVGLNVINDWVRLDGGQNAERGGVIALNSMATHEENFLADGLAIDATAGGPDPRLQAFFGISGYKSLSFIGNSYLRTTPVAFPTWMNIDGDLAGGAGTAFQNFLDVSSSAMVNAIDTINSAPDVRPWTGNQATFTVTNGAPAVVYSAGHGLKTGGRVALTTTGALPRGLETGVAYFVVAADTNSFQLASTPGGEAIATSGSQSGTHVWGNLSTLPYATRGGGQVNYLLMDSYTCETRIGARGPAHSKVLIGIADGEFGALDVDGNRIYQVEIGDRQQAPGGGPWRHAAHGTWEFGNVVAYMDAALDRRGIGSGQRSIKPGQAYQHLSTADKGIAEFTITLPQRMDASHELIIAFTGGGIRSLTWNAILADRATRLPRRIDGYTVLRLLYSRDTDAWQLLASQGGSSPYVELAGEGDIATDCALGRNFISNLVADGTLANPTNAQDGRDYNWLIVQDASGGHAFRLSGRKFKVPSGLAMTFATGANAVNKLTARYCAALDQYHVETFGAALA
jgi:hypothetical protein